MKHFLNKLKSGISSALDKVKNKTPKYLAKMKNILKIFREKSLLLAKRIKKKSKSLAKKIKISVKNTTKASAEKLSKIKQNIQNGEADKRVAEKFPESKDEAEVVQQQTQTEAEIRTFPEFVNSKIISIEDIELDSSDLEEEFEAKHQDYFEEINENMEFFEDELPTTEVVITKDKQNKNKFNLADLKKPDFWYNLLISALPFISVSLIMLFLYKLRGIIPFGNFNIAYSDFSQTTITAYYHLHDVIFEGKGLFYDFFTGFGTNSYAFMSFSGILSPISWITLLIPKDSILDFMPIFFILKLGAMATTFSIFVNKTFVGINKCYTLILSILYSLSAYTFLYFIVFQFIDVLIVFPLILLGLTKLYREGKIALYVASFTLSTIMCYYLSFAITLFILFSSIVVISFFVQKGHRKIAITNLAVGTVFSFLLSAFATVPTFLQISSSARLSSLDFLKVIGVKNTIFSSKVLPLITLSFFIAIFIAFFYKLITKRLTYLDKKFFWFSIFSFIFLAAPVCFESINLVWHMGSYVGFPLRYGFIIIAFILSFCAYYLSRFEFGRADYSRPLGFEYRLSSKSLERRLIKGKIDEKSFANTKLGRRYYSFRENKFFSFFTAMLMLASAICFVIRAFVILKDGASVVNNSVPILSGIPIPAGLIVVSVALCFAAAYILLNRLSTKSKITKPILIITVILNVTVFGFMFIGMDSSRYSIETSAEYVSSSVTLSEELSFSKGELSRVKDKHLEFNSNYPVVMGRAALSGWYHFIPENTQNSLKALGYSTVYTRTSDLGGTVFSDAILGVKDVISKKKENENFYQQVDHYDNFKLYRMKYSLPFGIAYSSKINSDEYTDLSGAISPFTIQNDMYKAFTGSDKNIITVFEVEPKLKNISMEEVGGKTVVYPNAYGTSQPSTMTYNLKLKSTQMLYLNLSDCYGGRDLVSVKVNDKQLFADSPYKNYSYNLFPSGWDNGLIELGCFSKGKVKVELTFSSKYPQIHFRTIELGGIALSKMEAFAKGFKDSDISYELDRDCLKYTLTAVDSQKLFLPINYDEGFTVTVNGQFTKAKPVFGNFTEIELQEGKNEVVLSFRPIGFNISLIISLAALVILLLFAIFPSLKIIVYNATVMSIIEIIYWIVGISLIIVIYFIFGFGNLFYDKLAPLFDRIINLISSNLIL